MTLARIFLIGCLAAMAGQAAMADDAKRDMLLAAKLEATRVVAPSLAKLGEGYPAASERFAALQAEHGLSPAFPYQQRNGHVVIDAISTGDTEALKAELVSLGMRNPVIAGNLVSGELPLSAVNILHHCPSLQFARPAAATTRVGLTTSQGDAAMYTDKVRKEEDDLDGSGIRVGVLSDSFNCRPGALTTAEDDIFNGDLPADINVVDDTACPGSDEGRAMMQLIHDVAPGASQAFHTAFTGQAGFAQGIIDLADAGSDIIVDDVIYFAEPMFQDGIIAQAADTVKSMGVPYFSSAGNNGRSAYEAPFRSSGVSGVFGGERHDFDPGPGVDTLQSFLLLPGTTFIVLQWDQPFASVSGPPGTQNDVDFILYIGGVPLTFLSSFQDNIGGDAVEIIGVSVGGPDPVEIQLGIELFSGAEPGYLKYVHFGSDSRFGGGAAEFDTESGTVYGHAGAEGAMAVGASAFFNTKRFNNNCKPACLNSFSSAGPVHILFDTAGNPVSELRQKPEVVGPDGGNTTFFGGDLSFPVPGTNEPDGFGNFFGTSASAPHVAALGALILQEEGPLTPDQLYRALERGAKDMKREFPRGVDDDTGFGFVDGRRAIEAADGISEDDESDDD